MTAPPRDLTGPPPPARSLRTQITTLARRLRGVAGPAAALVCLVTVAGLAFGFHVRGPEQPAVPAEAPTVAAHPPVPGEYPLPSGTGSAAKHADGTDSDEHERISALGLPPQVVAAYLRAEKLMTDRDPACRLDWSVLAGIGRIESGHARGGALRADGTTITPILGPRLDGTLAGTAVIRDTTDGRFDGDREYDRAVGPMQFLPGTWLNFGQDGNDDGNRDPHNIHDAALASATYLCAGDRDLSQRPQLEQAVFSYNPSWSYVRAVLAWADAYAAGRAEVSDSIVALAGGNSWANRTALVNRTRLAIPPTSSEPSSSSPRSATSPTMTPTPTPHPTATGAPTGTTSSPTGTTSSTPPTSTSTPARAPANTSEEPEAPPSCQSTTEPSEPSEPTTTEPDSEPSEPPPSTEPTEPDSEPSEPPASSEPTTTSPSSTEPDPEPCADTAPDGGPD